MDQLPDKPDGSALEVLADPAGVTLRWPVRSPGRSRYAVAAVVALWLCLWAAGWVEVFQPPDGADREPPLPRLWLWYWLIGWTIGGIVAVCLLWRLVRPERPESVRLEADRLRYDPGRSMMTAGGGGDDRPDPAPPPPPAPTRPTAVPRSAIRAFVLERDGGRQRLWLDRGADRWEIAAGLPEPDRQWLYAALQGWHGRHQPPR